MVAILVGSLLLPASARAADAPSPPFSQTWRADTDEAVGSAAVVGTSAIVVGAGEVHAIDVATGTEVWSLARQGGALVAPVVGAVGGRTLLVYVEAVSGTDASDASPSPGVTAPADVVAVDLEDRSERWRERIDAGTSAGVTVSDGVVASVSAEGVLSALSLEDGSTLWSDDRVGVSDSAPVISDGVVFAAGRVGTGASRVSALDADSGDRLWSRPLGGATSTSALSVGEGLVVVAGSDRLVHALDAETGEERWDALMVNIPSPVIAPLIRDDAVFMSDYAGGVYRFDTRDGDRVWDHQVNSVAVRSPLAWSGGFLAMGTNDGRLLAFDPADGHLVADVSTGAGLLGAFTFSGDLLLVPKGGSRPGLIAFGNDPEGALLDVVSPTEPDAAALLTRFAAAVVAVLVLLALIRLALSRRRDRRGRPAADAPEVSA